MSYGDGPVIEVDSLRRDFGGRPVLALEAVAIGRGERWLVTGPSGAGKTTLIHLLAGLLAPSAGTVRVDGRDLAAMRPGERDRFRGRHIGVVFQRLHLLDSLSAVHNVQLAQYLAGLPQDRSRCASALAGLGLGTRLDARPRELSRGEMQRVALARALVNAPRILLADEPTASLDDANCTRVIGLLEEQARACHASLVVASHDARLRDRFEHRLELRA